MIQEAGEVQEPITSRYLSLLVDIIDILLYCISNLKVVKLVLRTEIF